MGKKSKISLIVLGVVVLIGGLSAGVYLLFIRKETVTISGIPTEPLNKADQPLDEESQPDEILYHKNGGIRRQVWRNEDGQNHREGDKPAYINYYESGGKISETWLQNGIIHREGDKPAEISYDKDGNITYRAWYRDGRLMRLKNSLFEEIPASEFEATPFQERDFQHAKDAYAYYKETLGHIPEHKSIVQCQIGEADWPAFESAIQNNDIRSFVNSCNAFCSPDDLGYKFQEPVCINCEELGIE